VWSSLEGPRALFDRAVVWLIGSQVLLPGITTLARMVAEVRQEENDRLYATLYRATPDELRTEMARLLEVPEKRRVSELERLRLGPMRISGRAMEYALERTQQVRDLGAGKVDVAQVPAARLTGLARYGLTSKAPTLKRLEVTRQTATLLATVDVWNSDVADGNFQLTSHRSERRDHAVQHVRRPTGHLARRLRAAERPRDQRRPGHADRGRDDRAAAPWHDEPRD
jgi:hypothetical protein